MEIIFIIVGVLAVFIFGLIVILKLLLDRFELMVTKFHLDRFEKEIEKKRNWKPSKPDEFSSKNREKEKKEALALEQEMLQGVEYINQPARRENLPQMLDDRMLVDFVKPEGKHSKAAFMEKFKLIKHIMSVKAEMAAKGKNVGFWEIMMDAQARYRKSQKGKGM